MRFNIDSDTGSRITGWVLPDNPMATPRVRVLFGDEQKATVEARHRRAYLKDRGLHSTGICGFVLDEKNCKGIARAAVLRIYDDDTNLLVYQRRPAAKLVEEKVFRLETQLLRATALNDLLFPHFHMAYAGIEMFGQETISGILTISYTNSVMATGAIHYPAREQQLRDRGFKTAVLLRDPYEELAERLLILKWSASPQGVGATPYLGKHVLGAVKAMRDADLSTRTSVEALLARLDEGAQRVLFNTTTRLLTCNAATEVLDELAVSAALEALSEFDMIGVRDNVRGFLDVVEAVLGLPEPLADLKLPVYSSVEGLTAELKQVPAVAELSAMDIELFEAIVGAMDAVDRRSAPVPGDRAARRSGGRRG
jgi:hypothetical protein